MTGATEDVGTTKRKPLTPTQRLKLFEEYKGICVLCKRKINDPKWIDEHVIPLSLGGSNDMSNRGPAHLLCAAVKTNGVDGDIAKAAKAKRQKIAQVIGKAVAAKPIQSAPFPKAERGSKIGAHKIEKQILPPRAMFIGD
jgi:hypothetical protein